LASEIHSAHSLRLVEVSSRRIPAIMYCFLFLYVLVTSWQKIRPPTDRA
jgi:hypothetical protein